MGGCCSSSRRADTDRTPVYYYCPRTLEGREPLSFTHVTSSAVSAGLLYDTNLESSIPDTYRAPPAPLPYDVGLACSRTLPGSFGNYGIKASHMQPTDSLILGEAMGDDGFEVLDTCGSLKDSQCKSKTVGGKDSLKVVEDEPSKLSEPNASATEEEDVCPTCLEEYILENPRIITKCEHHFHLSCILEWMERSDTCPICDQIMIFNLGSEE